MADYKDVIFETRFTMNRNEKEFLDYPTICQNAMKRDYFTLRNELVDELNPRYKEWNAKSPNGRLAYDIYIYCKQKEIVKKLYETKWKNEVHVMDLDIEFGTSDIIGILRYPVYVKRKKRDVIRCELIPMKES